MPLITRQLLFPYSGQQIRSSVSKIEKKKWSWLRQFQAPSFPKAFVYLKAAGIFNLKAVLQIPQGRAWGRLQIPDLRDIVEILDGSNNSSQYGNGFN